MAQVRGYFTKFQFCVVFILVIGLSAENQKYMEGFTKDYCNPKLCRGREGVHIGCRKGVELSHHIRCRNFTAIPFGNELIKITLDIHNGLRNKIALGLEKRGNPGPFPSASDMMFLSWDEELSYLASLNVLQCKMSHDLCRNTDRFYWVGQNLAMVWTAGNLPSIEEHLRNGIQMWYDEVVDVNNSMVDYFDRIDDGVQRGHFTELVWSTVTQMGCAASSYKNYMGLDFLLMACNYNGGNTRKLPIYRRGIPCSNCPEGSRCHHRYKGLCVEKWHPKM